MVNSIVPVSLNEIESSDIQNILGHLACINTDKGELQLINIQTLRVTKVLVFFLWDLGN